MYITSAAIRVQARYAPRTETMTAALMNQWPHWPTTDSNRPIIEGWRVAAICGCGITE